MPLHFDASEFEDRQQRTLAGMALASLDGLLIFKQESMYWLTGYDTFGFCFFQCLLLRSDGRRALLTRSADLRQAELTSAIEDIRIWKDGVDAAPVEDLLTLIDEFGLSQKTLGVEWQTHGLTAAKGLQLNGLLNGKASTRDASLLISELRLIKSKAEQVYVERAADIADKALEAAIEHAKPGADEGHILARMHEVSFALGGDYPGNPFIIGSGPQALLCRYHSGRRKLDQEDQLTLEHAGVYRQYHCACMRTIPIGRASKRHEELFDAARDALLACEATLKTGNTMGDVFDAHVRTLDSHGLSRHRLNACGYSLGAVYAPSWMDWPMFYEGNPVEVQDGMVLFLHMIIMDSEQQTAMCLGRTSLVDDGVARPLSRLPMELVIGR